MDQTPAWSLPLRRPGRALAAALLLATACAGRPAVSLARPLNLTATAPPTADAAASGNGDVDRDGGGAPTRSIDIPEQLVIEGWLDVSVERVADAVESVRAQVQSDGGRVVNERVGDADGEAVATFSIRLPPARVDPFLKWLAGIGTIRSRAVRGTDVSREMFDGEIALENLRRTLERLRKLLDREGLEMKDILAIENEMTRLRGQIETIEGAQRFLKDRVALATLEISLRGPDTAELGPKAHLFPGARLSTLTLLSPDGRARNRIGGGAVIHTIAPGKPPAVGRITLELDVFEDADGEGNSLLATFGGSIYSEFLGRGHRRFLNPYLGIRIGYGYLDGSRFALAATAGVELFKHEFVLVDVNARLVGLFGDEIDVGIVTGANLVFAF